MFFLQVDSEERKMREEQKQREMEEISRDMEQWKNRETGSQAKQSDEKETHNEIGQTKDDGKISFFYHSSLRSFLRVGANQHKKKVRVQWFLFSFHGTKFSEFSKDAFILSSRHSH